MPDNDFYLSLPFRLKAQVGFHIGGEDAAEEAITDAQMFIKYRDGQAQSRGSGHVIKIQCRPEDLLIEYGKVIKHCNYQEGYQSNYFGKPGFGVQKELDILMTDASSHAAWPIVYFIFQSGSFSNSKLKQVELVLSFRDTGFSTAVQVGSYTLKVYSAYKKGDVHKY